MKASWCTRVPVPVGAAVLLLGLFVAGTALAQEVPAEKSWSYQLSSELMSPYCPGRVLTDCPSSDAARLREWIAEQEKLGHSKEEVQEQLYARFGDVILQAPKARGLGLAAYVIPVLAFLAGGAVVILFLRRQTREAALAAEGPHAVPVDPELERLVDEELEHR